MSSLSERAAIVLLALAAVACGGGSATEDAAPVTTPSPTASTRPGAPTGGHDLLLRADGLAEVNFGAPEQAALDRFTAILGRPAGIDSGTNAIPRAPERGPECTYRKTAFWVAKGVSITFRDGTFDGWEVARDPAPEGISTAVGVKIGAPLGTVRNEFGTPRFGEPRPLPVGRDPFAEDHVRGRPPRRSPPGRRGRRNGRRRPDPTALDRRRLRIPLTLSQQLHLDPPSGYPTARAVRRDGAGREPASSRPSGCVTERAA